VTLSTVTWHYQLDELSQEHRVIALDHRGHGRSTGDVGTFTIERLAQDLAEVIEQLDLRNAVVVGHSMGGMTLMRMAVDRPELIAERCAGLVLMNTDAGPGSTVPGWALLSRVLDPLSQRYLLLAGRLPGGLLPSTDLSYLLARMSLGKGPSPTHVELTRLMTGSVPAPILAEFWGSIMAFDVSHDLDRVDVPALVFVGSRDALTPVHQSKRIAERWPGARLEVLPGAGHMMMLESHAEVSAAIARFAQSVQ
jgi:pimeloyl-ACP methyl ester carboxylesterase